MVQDLRADSDPRGGRIRLSWTTPRQIDFPDFRGVKVVRRENSFPEPFELADDAGVFTDTQTGFNQSVSFTDAGLDGETNYYYAVAAFDGAAKPSFFPAFASALATTPYGSAEQLYSALPAVYQRFDTLVPPALAEVDSKDLTKGQLRRLVEMFGLQFDLLRSYASATRGFFDLEGVDGALLPLLAEWLGWPTDFTLPFSKQRNEIRYAPHFYRTKGIAANLRATLNRLTTWNAEIKEFVHNIFNANDPERLTIRGTERHGGVWDESQSASVATAYEGRPSAVRETDERQWLFYHATRKAQVPPGQGSEFCAPGDFSHLWFKLWDFDHWTPSQQLTTGERICKYPAAVRRSDASFWVFYSELEQRESGATWQLRLSLLAARRPAAPARLRGTQSGPFNLADGDGLRVQLTDGARVTSKTVVFHREHFRDIANAAAAEVAALLERELPGVACTVARDETVLLSTTASGAGVQLGADLAAASKLGLPATCNGTDVVPARLTGSATGPFALADNDTLTLRYDGGLPRVVTFRSHDFNNIAQATAAEVAAVIRALVPRGATDSVGRVVLTSPSESDDASVVVDVNDSSAAPTLGFGVATPLPSEEIPDDSEPSVCEDDAGGLWLFWSSRREAGRLKILYYRFDGTSWASPRTLTSGATADREPCALFDADGSRLWVFWTGRRADGRKNIFWRTTTNLDFDSHIIDAGWEEHELAVASGAQYDNAEPSAFVIGGGRAELFFSSNRAEGVHVWSNVVTPTNEQTDAQITQGQFTHSAPAALGLAGGDAKLWFRSNESLAYRSPLYPGSHTFDARYSGSTTIDTRDSSKFGISGRFDDTLHYLADTGRGNDNWYARDTVGVYLTPDTDDDSLIITKRDQIEKLLRDFLPIQVRAVVIVQQVFPEAVYNYDRAATPPDAPRFIGEDWLDTRLGEVYKGLAEDYADEVNFHFFRLWAPGARPDEMVNTGERPLRLSARLFLRNVKEGD
ncbi:MAG TPA: phage tail protein [Pyrinomonadaceae bacterium]|nr:phage tail protein [Pyrinomonadaceae bacterium]